LKSLLGDLMLYRLPVRADCLTDHGQQQLIVKQQPAAYGNYLELRVCFASTAAAVQQLMQAT
jgi:hypothetical protein